MQGIRFRRPHKFSKILNILFSTSFALVVVGLVLVMVAPIFAPEGTYAYVSTPTSLFLFGLAFALVASVICADLCLWIGMLHFLVRYDGREISTRAFWLLVCLFGLSYGAALYYWFVYRKFARNAELAQFQQPADSSLTGAGLS